MGKEVVELEQNEEVVESEQAEEVVSDYYEAESWQFSGCGD